LIFWSRKISGVAMGSDGDFDPRLCPRRGGWGLWIGDPTQCGCKFLI